MHKAFNRTAKEKICQRIYVYYQKGIAYVYLVLSNDLSFDKYHCKNVYSYLHSQPR